MASQYIVLSELLSDQAAFITSPKTSLANYWGALPPLPPPSVYGPGVNKPTDPSFHVIHTYFQQFCIYVNNLWFTVQLKLDIKFVSVHHLQHHLMAP